MARVYIGFINVRLATKTLFAVIVYFSVGLRGGADAFFIFAGTLVLVAFSAQSLGLLVGSVSPRPELAMVLTPMFFIPFTLMSGMFWYLAFVPEETMLG